MAIEQVRQGTVSSDIAELAAALMARQRLPLKALQDRRTELTQRASLLGTLKTKLLALRAELDAMAQQGALSPFAAKAATSSDTTVLAASATASAADATVSVTVTQLARRATHVSHRYADTGTTIADGGTGTFSFSLTIAGTVYTASVTINPGESDRDVLDKVAAAITAAVDGKASAVRVAPEAGASRLSVASAETGTANKITFTDTDGLLTRLGLVHPTPTAATDTTGGYVAEDLGNHELDAILVVDGLTYYRGSNTITDVVTGLTLTLKATSATAVTVKVQPDADRALERLKGFIAKWNDVLDFLAQHTFVDAKSGTRGALSLDSTYNRLASELRVRASAIVASQPAGAPNSLPALGIRADRQGKLAIADEAKVRDRFLADPAAVQTLFNAADGLATTLEAYIETHTAATGTINLTRNAITTRVSGLDGQIARLEASLAKREARLAEQLARAQALLQNFSRQAGQIGAFFASQVG